MDITIRNLQKRIRLNRSQIIKTAKRILRHEQIPEARLSVAFVTDRKIQSLNRQFLQRNHPTDVLAFDLGFEIPGLKPTKVNLRLKKIAGEIVISTDAICKNAKIYKTSQDRELTLYLAHGILHLLGFDDHKSGDIKRMRQKEIELLKFLDQ